MSGEFEYLKVAVDFPKIDSLLYYKAKKDFFKNEEFVSVPLGRRFARGLIVDKLSEDPLKDGKIKLKEISEKSETLLKYNSLWLDLLSWMSQYYHYSLGKLIFDTLPKETKLMKKSFAKDGIGNPLPYELNQEQLDIYQKISPHLETGFSQHLIHGITGSGKTSIYLKVIIDTLKSGKSVQFLLPEINLTPSFIDFFQTHVDCKLFLYHGMLSSSQKHKIWYEIQSEEKPILLIGVRSSLFLPINNLGLIIVDEEHETSFKQTDRCAYHARDVAIKKSHLHKIPIILGSATPMVETYHNFTTDTSSSRFYYSLDKRASSFNLPVVNLIEKGENAIFPFEQATLETIKKRLELNEQVIIYVNKLGYANLVSCQSCGFEFKNEACGCDNNLKFFKQKNILACSFCEFKTPMPKMCPQCSSLKLFEQGFGTEKVMDVLSTFFPQHKVARFDRDELHTPKQIQNRLEEFSSGQIDILIGTQMISKGHNFKNVNLVVVLGIDQMLAAPDFRGVERAFFQLVQVSGRAGRFHHNSEVVVQTNKGKHPLFELFQKHRMNDFYDYELPHRELGVLPPYSFLCFFYVSHAQRWQAEKEAEKLVSFFEVILKGKDEEVLINGPAPNFVEKRSGMFTQFILLKSAQRAPIHNLIESFNGNEKKLSLKSVIKVDVDPVSFF
ncbi:primosomal protein N' [Bacteriovoracaceae bacterium]|nr:primosomal protein N' [Bacteriovoracaceae bacterium]